MYHLRFDSIATRSRFIDHMGERGISVVFHYQPLHLSRVGRRLTRRPGAYPVSENAGDTLVRLPLHLDLRDADLDRVVTCVNDFVP